MQINKEKDYRINPKNNTVEIVERKGQGHPDYLCDKASEELSIALSKFYLKEHGRILHHNVDKAILAGGQSTAEFGGGEIIEPINLTIVGRAELVNKGLPIGRLVLETTKSWLKYDLPHLDVESDIIVDYKIRSGSTDLVGNFNEEREEYQRSNDTSIGVGFFPFTTLEKIVNNIEVELNSSKTKRRFPEIGEDIKIMGIRNENKCSITIASAMISKLIQSPQEYAEVIDNVLDIAKEECHEAQNNLSTLQKMIDFDISVNTADINDNYYLTVSGTSAEHGDDGQVGRGNRTSGLITPNRPMTLEAAAGKNPVSHVGKIYNIVARNIAEEICEQRLLSDATVTIVSQIGKPINEPQIVNVISSDDRVKSIDDDINDIIVKELTLSKNIWRGFIERKYTLY